MNERELREAVRAACLQAAREAYEDALVRGLCQEGAIEAALGAIETLDVGRISLDEKNNG